MKIALPTKGSEVDGHFGHCQAFTVFTVDEDRKIVAEETITPPAQCGCRSNIVPQLAGMGVSVMLAGNMGGGAVTMLDSNGIRVVRGCTGDVRQVTEAWLAGQVTDSGVGCEAHGHDGCPGHE